MLPSSANKSLNSLDLRPSRHCAGLSLIIHGGALIIVMGLSVALPAKLGLILVCLASFCYVLRLHALRLAKTAIVSMWHEDEDRWQLMNRQGEVVKGRLSGSSLLTTHLIILNFVVSSRRFMLPIVLFQDALLPRDFRRLRVHLLNVRNSMHDS